MRMSVKAGWPDRGMLLEEQSHKDPTTQKVCPRTKSISISGELEMQYLKSTPDMLNLSLHFKKIPGDLYAQVGVVLL